jgi:hypothetical protein
MTLESRAIWTRKISERVKQRSYEEQIDEPDESSPNHQQAEHPEGLQEDIQGNDQCPQEQRKIHDQ